MSTETRLGVIFLAMAVLALCVHVARRAGLLEAVIEWLESRFEPPRRPLPPLTVSVDTALDRVAESAGRAAARTAELARTFDELGRAGIVTGTIHASQIMAGSPVSSQITVGALSASGVFFGTDTGSHGVLVYPPSTGQRQLDDAVATLQRELAEPVAPRSPRRSPEAAGHFNTAIGFRAGTPMTPGAFFGVEPSEPPAPRPEPTGRKFDLEA